jgi:calcium/calmodulin-dependent protein kinase I
MDFFNEKNYFYIVLELVTGGELFDRICQKDHYSEREARAVFKQMVSGIATAHQRHICHRDLKPENVLLSSKTDDTTIKLADLGFAKILPAANSLMMTPCGTPGYVAPEVIASPARGYSAACDVWSMGVILFILLVGKPPFHSDRDDQNELFDQIRTGRFSMSPQDWSSVSEPAKDLVRRILVVDPARRITAHAILNHPWMRSDASALPTAHLAGTMVAMKRFVARRRLRKAIKAVLLIVRMKLMLAGSAAARARARGGTDNDQEAAFYVAAKSHTLRPEESEFPDAYLGVNRPMRTAAGPARKQY